MKKSEQGIAVVVVLIFTMVILVSIVVTASIVSLGSRVTTSGERQAYQALIAAESGLNSFSIRVGDTNYLGGLFGFPCWVQGRPVSGGDACAAASIRHISQLQLEDTATGPRADIDILALNSSKRTVTVSSTGIVPGNATKKILLDYLVYRLPLQNVAAPAALTSCPPITITGNANITGAGAPSNASPAPQGYGYKGTISALTTFSYLGTDSTQTSGSLTQGTVYPATINVADASLFDIGSFLKLGGSTFTVNEKTGTNRLTITPVPSASSLPIGGVSLNSTTSPPTAVDLVPVAIRAATSVSGTGVRLPVNDPTGFYVNDVIYVTDPLTSIQYAATVTAKGYTTTGDFNTAYLDVNLTVSAGNPALIGPGGTTIPLLPLSSANLLTAGAPVLRYVPSATSRYDISNNNNTATSSAPSIYQNNPVIGSNIGCGDALFQQIFSATKQDIYDRITPETTFPIPVTRGVHWVGNPPGGTMLNYTLNSGDLCGNGVVIVMGSLSFNGTCAAGFNGLLYVMGDLGAQGNSIVNGAIVVEGKTGSGSSADTTKVAGTPKYTYDLRAILDSSRNLSVLIMKSDPGTWRQQ